ncbi:MAG: HPF/RaiA family ribosome-associated protein [Bacteroidota bacterium]|nr:HPF/RaiA family ribosome-associated protein [Bacteroidota bacterium]
MTIEFETPYGKVSEKLVGYLRKEIMKLAHKRDHVARAEVSLKEDKLFLPPENKICSIRLTIFGDNLVAHSRASSFYGAAREAVADLNRKLKKHTDSLEEVTSSIDV